MACSELVLREARAIPPLPGKTRTKKRAMKIGIVEDQKLFRDLISKVCREDLECTVEFEACRGVDAILQIARSTPEIVLLDLRLADIDGFTVIDYTRASGIETRYLVVSCYCSEYAVHRCEQSGISGFIDKYTGMVKQLRDAISAIAGGKCYFCETFQNTRINQRLNPKSFLKLLSYSEQNVLSLLGAGHDDGSIASILGISHGTVEGHRSNLMRKLNLESTAKLIIFAINHEVQLFRPAEVQSRKRTHQPLPFGALVDMPRGHK